MIAALSAGARAVAEQSAPEADHHRRGRQRLQFRRERSRARAGEISSACCQRCTRLIYALLDLPVVTAAIVRGRCLGGGFELALACDFIFASEDSTLRSAGDRARCLSAGSVRTAAAARRGRPRDERDRDRDTSRGGRVARRRTAGVREQRRNLLGGRRQLVRSASGAARRRLRYATRQPRRVWPCARTFARSCRNWSGYT